MNRFAVVTVSVIGMIGPALWLGGTSSYASPHPGSTSNATTDGDPSVTNWPLNNALLAAADSAQAAATDEYFTAVSVDQATDAVLVTLTTDAPADVVANVQTSDADQAASDAKSGVVLPTIRVASTAPHSLAQLTQRWNTVDENVPKLAESGIDVQEVGPDASGINRVGVSTPVDAAQKALDSLLGPGWAEAYTAPKFILATTRKDDSPPWNGGDFINHLGGNNYSDCTAGPPTHGTTTGDDYMLSAAHCVYDSNISMGSTWKNGYVNPTNGNTNGNENTIGDVTYITNDSGTNTDTMLFDLSAGTSQVDFDCAWDCSGRATQESVVSNVQGSQVCASGAFEGQVCGGVTIESGAHSINSGDGYMVSPVYRAYNPNSPNKVVVGQGDSGGPVYSYDGSKLQIQGMIDAFSAGNLQSCPTATPLDAIRLCGSDVQYVDMKAIDSRWGIAINH